MCDTDPQARQAGPPVECQLHEAYYKQLVRLAALLTADPDAAEKVACDALAAMPPWLAHRSEDAARFLHRQVLIRCRHASPHQPDTLGFAGLPVVRALQQLPPLAREAVVLTHYLDLTHKQAAIVSGVSEAALQKRLGRGMQLLQDRLPLA